MTHCEKLLSVLADGNAHSLNEIHRRAGNMIVHSRISELRKRGHEIVCEKVKGKRGAAAYRYTWLDAPPQPTIPTAPLGLSTDEIAPRTEQERYRLFRVRNGGDPEIVATVSSREAVGVALCALGEEGEWDDYCVGLMDALDHHDGKRWVGKWLVKPWQAT